MKKLFLFLIFVGLSFLNFGQPHLKWHQNINGSVDFINVDSEGNVISFGRHDVCFAKFDSSGSLIYNTNTGFGSSYLTNYLIDDSNNIYLSCYSGYNYNYHTGLTSSSARCAKFNSAGNLIWTNDYYRNHTMTIINQGIEIFIDSLHNVWMNGITEDNAGYNTFNFISNYNVNGQMQWLKADSLRPSSNFKCALDKYNNIYYATSLYHNGIEIGKYDSYKNLIWSVGDTSSPNINDFKDVKFINSSLYVVREKLINRYGISVLQFDSAGQLLNVFNYEHPVYHLSIKGVAHSINGNFYIYGAGGNYDGFILKLNSNLSFSWIKFFDGSQHHWDYFNACFIDRYENIFIEGTGNYDTTQINTSDMLTLKYDSSGVLLWEDYYHPIGSLVNYGLCITVDDSGNIYTGGEIYLNGVHGELRKYSEFPVNTTEINNGKSVLIYPNPAINSIQIRLADENNLPADIYFYDVTGKLVQQSIINSDRTLIKLNFNPGIYFAHLIFADKKIVKKIVVE